MPKPRGDQNVVAPPSGVAGNSIVSLAVDGYRGLREFEVSDLAPVTVFTGDNGAGKTRLLESAFAIFGRKTLSWLLSLQAHRGLQRASRHGPNLSGIFDAYSDRGMANFRAKTANGNRIDVTIQSGARQEQMIFKKDGLGSFEMDAFEPLLECVSRVNGEDEGQPRRLVWKADGPERYSLEVEHGESARPRGILLHPALGMFQEDDAKRFGDAVMSRMGNEPARLLRVIDSRIERIEFVPASKGEFFGVQLKDGPVVPIGMLGGGVSNLLRYALCLIDTAGGFLGIDEIENGFFHRKQSDIFRGLLKLREETETQLMMSTHSAEALRSIVDAANESRPEDLAVVHLRRDENGVHPTVFRGKDAFSSLEHGYELR